MHVDLHTNHGTIRLALFEQKAPKTVENFLNYVRDGFYDGTLFHRVIEGFVAQGGGMEPGMREKPTREPVPNEADNGLSNERGMVAMARTPDPHSATSQFFINLSDNTFLDHRQRTNDGWGYCVFGKVSEGMDVVDAIGQVDTGVQGHHQDVPVKDVVLERAEVVGEEPSED